MARLKNTTINGSFSINNNNKTIEIGCGSSETYILNNKSNSYLQLKDNGKLEFNNNAVYHEGNKPSLSSLGAAPLTHTHSYAGSSSAGGDANAAVKLATARTINGTSFDGTGNILTTSWGASRTITIGNTSKSVNGSSNITYSLSEIGALETGKTAIGNSEFTSSSRSVTINLGLTMPNAAYHITITPTSNPNGGLGEVYVSSRTTTQFVVTTSGSANFTFSWMAISK